MGVCLVAIRVFFLLFFFHTLEKGPASAPQGRFGWRWYNIFQILITLKKEEKKIKGETSKVQHITEITIPSMVSNIKITLKFHALL